MSFPLFLRPGTVVFLDDDPDYLEMLALVLPRQWHVKLFLRPAECIDALMKELPFWEADAWNQQQVVDGWREGKSLIPQILAYWSAHTERYAHTRVCVVDYSMPAMDGLQALGELAEWPGSRVLLTGQADEQVAVRAFNRGLIDQFIAKQTPDISRTLVDSVNHLLQTPNARHAQTWRATLSPEQNALLRLPSVARDLTSLANRHWVEYVVIGNPFGVLGMAASGKVTWLQLETREGLKALSELAEIEGVQAPALEAIRAGRQLADLELGVALARKEPARLADTVRFGDREELLGALFEVPPASCPDVANSYERWLQRQDKRNVEA